MTVNIAVDKDLLLRATTLNESFAWHEVCPGDILRSSLNGDMIMCLANVWGPGSMHRVLTFIAVWRERHDPSDQTIWTFGIDTVVGPLVKNFTRVVCS